MSGNINSDIVIIKNDIRALSLAFNEFKDESKEMIKRVSDVEITQARQGEKLSNWNLFQTAFTIIIGAIATYLGAKQ